MKKVTVHFEGWGQSWTLGTLADDGQNLLFEYSTEALQKGLELSPLHLPLRKEAFGGFPLHLERLPGFVADSLPDGWGRLLMDRLFRKNGLDPARMSPLDRLSFLNGRVMGALTYKPSKTEQVDAQDIKLLELAEEAQMVLKDRDTEALRMLALMGGSPHGARPKVLVHIHPVTGDIGTHSFAGSQPWLVKFQAQYEHKEACAIEEAYAELARDLGIDMPATRYFDLGKNLAGFGIERFDRMGDLRVPVHTLAGLLQVNFRLPSAVDYTTFLRATRRITRSAQEVDKAYGRAVFNVLFNNRDDHAKNFSFRMQQDGEWTLAPAYDLTFNEGPGGEHQMDVCGEGRKISRAHMLELAKKGDVKLATASLWLDKAADLAEGMELRMKAHPIRPATRKQIVARVQANLKCLAK